MPTRDDALTLLQTYNTNPALIQHGLQVEACMRHFARKFGEDEEQWGIVTEVEPLSLMEKTLYAVDELSGLVNACVLVRPSRSIMDLGVKSVKKKFKQKSFAAGVDREIVTQGAAMLEMELGELMEEVIAGMKTDAEAIGVAG